MNSHRKTQTGPAQPQSGQLFQLSVLEVSAAPEERNVPCLGMLRSFGALGIGGTRSSMNISSPNTLAILLASTINGNRKLLCANPALCFGLSYAARDYAAVTTFYRGQFAAGKFPNDQTTMRPGK